MAEKTTSPQWHPQHESLLLSVPTEIRLEIYSRLFSSTRLLSGWRSLGDRSKFVRYFEHSLAILRVCRQLNAEIDDSWISKVLFDFLDAGTLYLKLKRLPPARRNKIRHLRARCLDYFEFVGTRGFHLATDILHMFPGLRLDTFTILEERRLNKWDLPHVKAICHSQGWKTLRILFDRPSAGDRSEVAPNVSLRSLLALAPPSSW
ncbi:hypothetical protein QBC35DRAFT_394936 [Podospora australis]|uniref:F-box domain-containing protein n=1 Tax=Podospora australis TaxID=1536484 RepID=A0AAN6WMD3_9PEZI|nr:hypothetical protein QBC35DRAFT_394936 [Podospora australis]